MEKKIQLDKYFIFQRNTLRIENLKDEEISEVKLNMLNKLVESEENKLHSKIHSLYLSYYPEWILNSKKLIKTVYRRLLKTDSSLFLNFSNHNTKYILSGMAESVRNNIDDYVKIHLDYECIKNLAYIILNCIHFIKLKKKSIASFLKKETVNLFSKDVCALFTELESIKSIKISLFYDSIDSEMSYKSNNSFKKDSKKDILDINNDSINNNLNKTFSNMIKSDSQKEFSKKDEINIDLVYIFHLFLGFLFPNHLEIELYLNVDDLLNKYRNNIDGLLKDSYKVCKKFEKYFVIILVTTYFISKNDKIQKLKIDVNESNIFEMFFLIQNCIHIKKELKLEIKKKEFTFIDNFERNTNLFGLDLCFNSFDDILFKKINCITFKNFGLRSLTITLFPQDSDKFGHKIRLRKIANLKQTFLNDDNFQYDFTSEDHPQIVTFPKLNFHNLKRNSRIVYFNNKTLDEELYSEDCNEAYDKLFENYNENMKHLFIIIESKLNILRHLTINISPPHNMLDQICYISVLTIFIYNLLKLIGKENSEISQIEMNSENIPLNFQLLGLKKQKDIGINLRKSKIENFNFNIKIEHYFNLTKFIPESIVCLKLNALTHDTLIVLVKKLKKHFQSYKSLIELSLNVYLSNRDLEKLSHSTKEFFKLTKPKNLENLSFRMKYVLKNSDVDEILEIINNNDNYYNYKDRINIYNLDFSCVGKIDISKKIAKLDERYISKMLCLMKCLSKSFKFKKLNKQRNIKKNLCLFLYSYTKNIYLS